MEITEKVAKLAEIAREAEKQLERARLNKVSALYALTDFLAPDLVTIMTADEAKRLAKRAIRTSDRSTRVASDEIWKESAKVLLNELLDAESEHKTAMESAINARNELMDELVPDLRQFASRAEMKKIAERATEWVNLTRLMREYNQI